MKHKPVAGSNTTSPMASTKLGKAGDSIPKATGSKTLKHGGNSSDCPMISKLD